MVVAAMMEVMVMMGMFTGTAVRMKASSPGPNVSQTRGVFAAPSLLVGSPWEASKGTAFTRPDRTASYLEPAENI